MSWEIALIASSVAIAGSQFISARTTAAAGKKRADIEAAQNKTNAELASLQALQQEDERRRDFQMIEAWNSANVTYDPFSSPSFLAIEEDNVTELASDISNIQLMGQINRNRSLQSAEINKIEAKTFRTVGRYAWLQPAGTIAEGAYKAKKLS